MIKFRWILSASLGCNLAVMAPTWAQCPPPKVGWLAKHRDYRPPMPAPLGASVNSWQEVQIAEAAKDQFVIYLMEWASETVPGPYGQYHLERIAEALPGCPFPVIIQPCPEDRINFARRSAVVTFLLNKGISDAEQRVRVAYPQAEGLFGIEAPRIFFSTFSGRGGGIGGGFGGGGLGGGLGVSGGGLGIGGAGMGGGRGY